MPSDKTAEERARRVAAAVRKAREDAMMTQVELAIATKLAERTIRRVEQEGRPSFETLRAIAAVLPVDSVQIHRDVRRANPSPWLAAGKVSMRFVRGFAVMWALMLASPIIYYVVTVPVSEVQKGQDAPLMPLVTMNPGGSFRSQSPEEAAEARHGSWVRAYQSIKTLAAMSFLLTAIAQAMRIMFWRPSREAEIVFDALDRIGRAFFLRLGIKIRHRTA